MEKSKHVTQMNLLIVIPYAKYYSDFAHHLNDYLNGITGVQRTTVTIVTPPFYSYYIKKVKWAGKKKSAICHVFNFIFFLFRFVITSRRYDAIILASHVIAIPFLFAIKVLPFMRPKKDIIVTSFFLHDMGKKKIVQRILRFLLADKKILLLAQSAYEEKYYSQLTDKAKVIHFPFCQHEVSFSENCGKGEEYIFSGGYTNRDYDCLLKAAQEVDHDFLVISSRLNQIDHSNQKVSNVRILSDTTHKDFHGYLKNSKIVVIPLKEETGAAGQMVALAAMAFKKPIIYTKIDSVSQYFEDGVSGISYERNNSEDLVEKIEFLLSDAHLRKELGTNAFKRYCENYHISKYCEFLAGLISDRSDIECNHA